MGKRLYGTGGDWSQDYWLRVRGAVFPGDRLDEWIAAALSGEGSRTLSKTCCLSASLFDVTLLHLFGDQVFRPRRSIFFPDSLLVAGIEIRYLDGAPARLSSGMERITGDQAGGASGDWFVTTHWSVVLAAGQASSPGARPAMEELCRTYWYPLYAYVRRRGNSPHDAQDLTQEFFARLLEDNSLAQVSAAKGKFRSFLLAVMNHFLSRQLEHARALKRGGGRTLISLDEFEPEERYHLEPFTNLSADQLFERRWARTVLDQALARLRAEFTSAGKLAQFERLKVFLQDEAASGDYERLAGELAQSPGAVAVAVHRLRLRYRELVRTAIANTVSSPEELEEEMRYLFTLLTQ